jgi:RHS repeat-associated protein
MTSRDHLGSPRHITSGSTGAVVGEQAFGPYGERMVGTFNGKVFPSGYRPATGWTGHIDEDPTGLIYMRGRYYSPLWHRFVSSDQGVDPNSLNQFAYVGGSPFTATDPSGMYYWCLFRTDYDYYEDGSGERRVLRYYPTEIEYCIYMGGGGYGGGYTGGYAGGYGGGGSGPSGGPPNNGLEEKIPDQCKKLNELGVTKEQYADMQASYEAIAGYQSMFSPYDTPNGTQYRYSGLGTIALTMHEHGFAYSGGHYISGTPVHLHRGTNNFAYMYQGVAFYLPDDATGLTSHMHINIPGAYFVPVGLGRDGYLQPHLISGDDMRFAASLPNMVHTVGWEGGLMQYNQSGLVQNIGGQGWWDIDCSRWLK